MQLSGPFRLIQPSLWSRRSRSRSALCKNYFKAITASEQRRRLSTRESDTFTEVCDESLDPAIHVPSAKSGLKAERRQQGIHGDTGFALPFHTDLGDTISLDALSRRQIGGSFYLAKAADVYEKVTTICLELAQTLLNDWTHVE
ncbi:hypothetical protein MPH_09214 [Macrophomina phaseolina MS6]|uniref:Uncharacterized protein n=1 Tax=Macrophomina phaseolina (strain MS6) TaxID=1126212 RepID=K2RLF0_MACPH|nr:hypothetical protein MPH_09214 [Macrophomina phaseolina MS6]